MAIPRELRAVAGQAILPVWRALLRYIDKTGIIRGPGVRMQVTPHGTYVWADSDWQPWSHPFEVSTSAGRAVIAPGTVAGLSPFIGEVNISGEDEEGNPVKPPKLDLAPQESGFSYVGIEVIPDKTTSTVSDSDPGAFQIVERAEIPQGNTVGDSTFYPLARLEWSEKGRIKKVFQIVHHNLNYLWLQGSPLNGTPERHIFWAA